MMHPFFDQSLKNDVKMNETNCPICYSILIHTETTPCMDCGTDNFELSHYQEHQYKEYEVYFSQSLILCDFCDVDFASYDPTYFGFSPGKRIGLTDWNLVKVIENKALRKDKYCPKCKHRLPFLNFVMVCRKRNNFQHETN